ncbi:hypothetical protein Tco_0652778 [Tanacetum coccineum]|uniref:Uncharacterized protein n=1 Tax=Tanacetum coccineum TaxID=301880 RepID=A0ABQ4WYL5_9ASTR
MDGCTKGPQLEEDENLNTGHLGPGGLPREEPPLPPDKLKEALLQHLSENSQTSPSTEEIGGYSSDGSSRSMSRDRSRSAWKHRKSVSRKKGISKSHWSVRLEARSRSKSKSVKSKPQLMKASRRKSSSDSGYNTVSNNSLEDLSMPYKWPKPMPFTFRITCFRYHRPAKLPPNV